ncbi:Uncharacterized protein BP5553_03252 [Venustampulla echinocandica]|uniref:Copper-containing nitrite reductase n=1 Tax=Venustampulla echinocandica TaxID=2656787 RepID=A0A370TTP7_9HELO|nr:Uncharacterized protein BP5553_03252 [Venustampulla echinocandica]RDL38912.1 Uncharacterized protein BP5553_03252 [Venustampulla echinocandica]
MSYLRAPLRTSWRLAESRPFISPRGGASWSRARRISTDSFKTATKHASNNRLLYALVLSTSVSLGTFLYSGRQDSVRMNWGPAAKAGGDSVTTQQTIPFIPARPGPTTDPNGDIYETLDDECLDVAKLPRERAIMTSAPLVPPPITRDYPVLLEVPLTTTTKEMQLTGQYKYEQWTFNDIVPGPFIRARVGDVVELALTNEDHTGNPHNIDCHAFTGPGGGAAVTTAEEDQTKTGRFKLLCPGLYLYHCAAGPVPVHIANGMYGLIYVQPAEGDLPPVDREYYVMQSEFYHEPPEVLEDGRRSTTVEFSYPNGLREEPNLVVFNGSESAMTRDRPLKANVGETVRVFFGNAGPNLTSAFHVIGSNFKNVYRDGDVLSPPGRFIQTVGVPPGAATIVDMKMVVPGTYAFVDHAIFRMDKGAVGFLNVSGKAKADIFESSEHPNPCVGCKLHP